jgi:hypothetical protein
LSPDRMMLMPMIFSAATQKAGCIMSVNRKSTGFRSSFTAG